MQMAMPYGDIRRKSNNLSWQTTHPETLSANMQYRHGNDLLRKVCMPTV